MNHRIALMTSGMTHENERIYRLFASILRSGGWRVEIINPVFEGIDEQKIRFRRVALPQSAAMRAFSAHKLMCSALLESRADVAVLHDAELLMMLPHIKRRTPLQIIFDMDGAKQQDKGLTKRIFEKAVMGQKLRFADAVTASDDDTAELISQKYGLKGVSVAHESDKIRLLSLCNELEKTGRYNI